MRLRLLHDKLPTFYSSNCSTFFSVTCLHPQSCSRLKLKLVVRRNYSNEKSEKFFPSRVLAKKTAPQAGELRNLLYQKLIKIYANMYCVRERRSSERRSTEWWKNYELVFPRRAFFMFFVGKRANAAERAIMEMSMKLLHRHVRFDRIVCYYLCVYEKNHN